jgi:uncharacterized membrane protein
MFQRLATLWRHLWLDESDTRRTLGDGAQARLAARVAQSETRHSGEVRLCVEASLPPSYLWRHLAQRTPVPQLARQRARMLFSKLGVWDTERNNGVLIYLLLAERRIEIVADRAIHAVAGDAVWNALVQRMAQAFAAGQYEAGLTQAVDGVTEQLVAHFPLRPGERNPNELPDAPAMG